jgi:hypothetical protein
MKKMILMLSLFIAPITSANAYLIINPASMEFGGVQIGTQASQMFFINNVGNTDARIQWCNVFGAFRCQLNCYGTLSAGESCSGTIFFHPETLNYEFETVNIQTNEGNLMMTVHGFGRN